MCHLIPGGHKTQGHAKSRLLEALTGSNLSDKDMIKNVFLIRVQFKFGDAESLKSRKADGA